MRSCPTGDGFENDGATCDTTSRIVAAMSSAIAECLIHLGTTMVLRFGILMVRGCHSPLYRVKLLRRLFSFAAGPSYPGGRAGRYHASEPNLYFMHVGIEYALNNEFHFGISISLSTAGILTDLLECTEPCLGYSFIYMCSPSALFSI